MVVRRHPARHDEVDDGHGLLVRLLVVIFGDMTILLRDDGDVEGARERVGWCVYRRVQGRDG